MKCLITLALLMVWGCASDPERWEPRPNSQGAPAPLAPLCWLTGGTYRIAYTLETSSCLEPEPYVDAETRMEAFTGYTNADCNETRTWSQSEGSARRGYYLVMSILEDRMGGKLRITQINEVGTCVTLYDAEVYKP